MNKLPILAVVALLVAGVVYYFYNQATDQPPIQVENPLPKVIEVEPGPPPIQYPAPPPPPVEPEAKPKPLPPLGRAGDQDMHETILALLGTDSGDKLGLAPDFVRRFVTTVDGLSEDKLPLRVRPIARTPGHFAVSGNEDKLLLDRSNYSRYDPLIATLNSVSASELVELYSHYYPLLQDAYDELGYPDTYFNDRMVAVIDNLLATPDIDGPIALVRPHVMYKFADPELESLSAGSKVLLRVGPEHAKVIKQKLREIRAQLVKTKTP